MTKYCMRSDWPFLDEPVCPLLSLLNPQLMNPKGSECGRVKYYYTIEGVIRWFFSVVIGPI